MPQSIGDLSCKNTDICNKLRNKTLDWMNWDTVSWTGSASWITKPNCPHLIWKYIQSEQHFLTAGLRKVCFFFVCFFMWPRIYIPFHLFLCGRLQKESPLWVINDGRIWVKLQGSKWLHCKLFLNRESQIALFRQINWTYWTLQIAHPNHHWAVDVICTCLWWCNNSLHLTALVSYWLHCLHRLNASHYSFC